MSETILFEKNLDQLFLQVEFGADEYLLDAPINRYQETKEQNKKPRQTHPTASSRTLQKDGLSKSIQSQSMPPPPSQESHELQLAYGLTRSCQTLGDLYKALENFQGCAIKKTATNTVIYDGVQTAPIMIIGEAPGSQEDRKGKPFIGHSGQLLDRILAEISLSRTENVYITNVLFWRPPGNRTPTDDEIMLCRPFVERQIELIKPKIILFIGGISAKSYLHLPQGITRIRGKWHDYTHKGLESPIPALPLLHPSFLIKNPIQKRLMWQDMLLLQDKARDL